MRQIIIAMSLVLGLCANAQPVQKKSTKPKRPAAPMVVPVQPTTPAGQVAPTAESTLTAPETSVTPVIPETPTPPPTAASKPAESSSAGSFMSGYYGLNVGVGVPYLTQVGLNYLHSSNMFSAEIAYDALNMTIDDVSVGLNKTELSARWHPFMGAFYLGIGLGKQAMTGKAKDTINGQSVEVKVDITSSTLTPQVGWMWGIADGGFFFGVDFGFQSPSGVKSTFTTNADVAAKATAEYKELEKDALDKADKLGKTGIPTFTLLRFGYLF